MTTRTSLNVGVLLQDEIAKLPAGLNRAILRVMSFHVGRGNAIPRVDLVDELAKAGFDHRKEDRPVRLSINQLRKAGLLICSTGGRQGGYFMASSIQEVEDYLDVEVRSRAMDLLEQEKAMKQAAEKTWGRYSPEKQLGLF